MFHQLTSLKGHSLKPSHKAQVILNTKFWCTKVTLYDKNTTCKMFLTTAKFLQIFPCKILCLQIYGKGWLTKISPLESVWISKTRISTVKITFSYFQNNKSSAHSFLKSSLFYLISFLPKSMLAKSSKTINLRKLMSLKCHLSTPKN